MTQKVYDPAEKHPPEVLKDLNPQGAAGINYGNVGPHPERNNPRTAHDVKGAYPLLNEFTDDQLKQVPIMPAGSRLEQDAAYIDLADPGRKEFKALGSMEAGPDQLLVPKAEVDYQLWNRLRGVTDPARTGGVPGT